MSTEDHKAVVRAYFALVDRLGAGEDIRGPTAEVVARDARHHMPGVPGPLDNDGFLQFLAAFAAGFPGFRHEIEDQLAEGDRVATRITWHGTHTGSFQGLAPTGKPVRMGGLNVTRLAGGRVAEQWVQFDALGLMQQLGAGPG